MKDLQQIQLFATWKIIMWQSLSLCIVTEYEIATTTADTDNASTTENVWIVLEGRKARSKEFVLENKKKKFLR